MGFGASSRQIKLATAEERGWRALERLFLQQRPELRRELREASAEEDPATAQPVVIPCHRLRDVARPAAEASSITSVAIISILLMPRP